LPKEKRINTGECTTCWVWSLAPEKFDETKNFMVCPNCDRNMYLGRQDEGANLEEIMRPSKQVVSIKLRRHGEK
jgi:hypothetical protein